MYSFRRSKKTNNLPLESCEITTAEVVFLSRETFIMKYSCETTLASNRKAIIKRLLARLRFKRFMVANSEKR